MVLWLFFIDTVKAPNLASGEGGGRKEIDTGFKRKKRAFY